MCDEKIKSLKEQMDITTLVQLRDGQFLMAFLNKFDDDYKGLFNKTCCKFYFEEYDDNLKHLTDSSLDVIKIKFPTAGSNFTLVKDFFENKLNVNYWDWEREEEEEEPITKDVSLEEINALLKEKYPDVEKFNLPIDK